MINSVNSNINNIAKYSVLSVTDGNANRQESIKQNSNNDKRTDSVEISSEAYKKQKETAKLTATSGKDMLSIERGKTENSYIVDFEHLAFASRAISRGYITVNGQDIQLSDETKEKLMAVAEEADKKSEAAFLEMITKYNIDISKQQADVWKRAFETPDSIKILLGLKTDDKENPDRISTPDPKDYEWKTYNPTMEIKIDGNDISIGSIAVKEISLQEGK